MKTLILSTLSTLAIVGCGSSGESYTTGGDLPENTPSNAPALIIQGSDGAKAVMQYTTLEDGSVLVECGDGDDYSCMVQIGEPTDEEEANVTEADDSCDAADGGCNE